MFQDQLKQLRKREHLTQEELAAKLGIGRSTLGMYETGRREPPFEFLQQLADFFHTDVNTLLGYTPVSANFSVDYSAVPSPALPVPDDAEAKAYEELLLLFSQVPEADRPLVLGMIRAALTSKGLL